MVGEKAVPSGDEAGLLTYWRGLSVEERETLLRLLKIPKPADPE